MLIKIWESDYKRIIRAAYAEGVANQLIDSLVTVLLALFTETVRCYRVETELGAFCGIMIVETATGTVAHSYMRPHFKAKYEKEFNDLVTQTTIRKEFYSANLQNLNS